MKNKYIRVACTVLVTVLTLTCTAGCEKKQKVDKAAMVDPMEIEKVDTYSFDYIGGTDVMPIAGYYGPSITMTSYNGNNQPSTLTDEFYQAVADCGINLLTYPQIDYAGMPENTIKMLDLAHKYGIGQVVYDSNVMYNYDITKQEAVEAMKPYMTHPAFAGFFVFDEPGNAEYISYRTQMSELQNISKVLNVELDMFTYLNLSGADLEKIDADIYYNYIKEYCETQNQKYLCFDHYPSFAPDTVHSHESYIWNVAIIRQLAQEYNIPWWGYVGAGSQWNDAQAFIETNGYYPSEAQLYWNVNTMLAFGAKGIHYFALSQPYWFAYGTGDGKYDFERNCLIGAYGNKNRWYYYAQSVNEHIQAIDEVLMNSASKGIIISVNEDLEKRDMSALTEGNHIDKSAFIEGTSWRELADISGDVLVGCFNYVGKTALYVVNYSYDYAQKVDLSFVQDCDVKIIQNAETRYVSGNSLTLDMAAGEGILLVLE